mmetsp:Transcript_3030/g.7885  ORF Transcript_3030/g.7885 Transcript_3030/m.7885 type:complete len:278 (-) Transcript_3030:2135-2968(-)
MNGGTRFDSIWLTHSRSVAAPPLSGDPGTFGTGRSTLTPQTISFSVSFSRKERGSFGNVEEEVEETHTDRDTIMYPPSSLHSHSRSPSPSPWRSPQQSVCTSLNLIACMTFRRDTILPPNGTLFSLLTTLVTAMSSPADAKLAPLTPSPSSLPSSQAPYGTSLPPCALLRTTSSTRPRAYLLYSPTLPESRSNSARSRGDKPKIIPRPRKRGEVLLYDNDPGEEDQKSVSVSSSARNPSLRGLAKSEPSAAEEEDCGREGKRRSMREVGPSGFHSGR